MKKWNKSLFLKFLYGVAIAAGLSSCQLFEADVADFMEKYTETAGIEEYEFNVETYNDGLSQLCISSEADTTLSLYMRNPKSFTLTPSITFPELDETLSTADVTIQQTDRSTISVSFPTSFLVPADKGNNISAEISLYEPMSGREFDHYTVDVRCNTIPPQILNPTIMNSKLATDPENVQQYFIIAFDLPDENAVAIRHTDISQIVINGAAYDVTIPQPTLDSEGIPTVVYNDVFSDTTRFTKALSGSATTGTCPYTVIGGKTFTPTKNSYYFDTREAFVSGDKQYTIQLKDGAGLTSTRTASTTITKLSKPVICSVDNVSGITQELSGTGVIGVPYDEDSGFGTITITPPSTDHKGDPVSGATVYYRIYEATGLCNLYTSGTTTTTKTINLPQNTYRVEAYAVRTNYEQSSTENLKIRLMNNAIYIEAVTDPNDSRLINGSDGSANAPFPTISDAIADINGLPAEDKKNSYVFYIKGDFTVQTYDSNAALANYGVINIGRYGPDIDTSEVTFKKWPGSAEAKLSDITVYSQSNLDKVTIGDITLQTRSSSQIAIHVQGSTKDYEINGTTIIGNLESGFSGIKVDDVQTINISSCNITNSYYGILVSGGSNVEINDCNITGFASGSTGIDITSGSVTLNSGTIKDYTGNSCAGITIGTGATLKLYGGTITGNTKGIEVESGATVKVHGNPVVTGNQSSDATPVVTNLKLPADTSITVDEALTPGTNGCRIGVTTTGAPQNVGDAAQSFTSHYKDNNPTALPSSFFSSDTGLSIVLNGDEAGLVVAGASGPDVYSAIDYTFSLAAADVHNDSVSDMYPGQKKMLLITPTVTRPDGTLYYKASDKKLYKEEAFTNAVANGNTISWSAALYNGGHKVCDIPSTDINYINNTVLITFTAPVNSGSYTLKVYANFLGVPHSQSFPLLCSTNVNSVVSHIHCLNSMEEYNVTVTGSISPDDLIKVKNAIASVGLSNIYINLDASGTTNSVELNAYANPVVPYNGGAYFNGCTALKSIKLPNWMSGILPGMFKNSGLTSIEIPDTVTDICESAFEGCTGLTEITLPASLCRIEASAFNGCTNLTTINYADTKAEWLYVERESGWHEGVPTTVVHCTDGDIGLDVLEYVFHSNPTYASSKSSDSYGTNGIYVFFGDWPQTIKDDAVTVDETQTKTQGAFTYYKGDDGYWYAKVMENAYNNNLPYSNGTNASQSSANSYKYFKVEPIKWRIVDQNYNGTGNYQLVAERILTANIKWYDSSANRDGSIKQSNYKHSRIRAYLNGISYNKVGETSNEFVNQGFLQTAFNSNAQDAIVLDTVYNDASSNNGSNNSHLCENTTDKVFLVSYHELTNITGSRKRKATDYAVANHVWYDTSNGCGYWWLRTPSNNGNIQYVNNTGSTLGDPRYGYGYPQYGVVPSIFISPLE